MIYIFIVIQFSDNNQFKFNKDFKKIKAKKI